MLLTNTNSLLKLDASPVNPLVNPAEPKVGLVVELPSQPCVDSKRKPSLDCYRQLLISGPKIDWDHYWENCSVTCHFEQLDYTYQSTCKHRTLKFFDPFFSAGRVVEIQFFINEVLA